MCATEITFFDPAWRAKAIAICGAQIMEALGRVQAGEQFSQVLRIRNASKHNWIVEILTPQSYIMARTMLDFLSAGSNTDVRGQSAARRRSWVEDPAGRCRRICRGCVQIRGEAAPVVTYVVCVLLHNGESRQRSKASVRCKRVHIFGSCRLVRCRRHLSRRSSGTVHRIGCTLFPSWHSHMSAAHLTESCAVQVPFDTL